MHMDEIIRLLITDRDFCDFSMKEYLPEGTFTDLVSALNALPMASEDLTYKVLEIVRDYGPSEEYEIQFNYKGNDESCEYFELDIWANLVYRRVCRSVGTLINHCDMPTIKVTTSELIDLLDFVRNDFEPETSKENMISTKIAGYVFGVPVELVK